MGAVAWTTMFRPWLPEKYDGSINPAEFLEIYITIMHSAGRNEVLMANYFLVTLIGSTRSWLMNLPQDSVPC
jgi:hypothetical protein